MRLFWRLHKRLHGRSLAQCMQCSPETAPGPGRGCTQGVSHCKGIGFLVQIWGQHSRLKISQFWDVLVSSQSGPHKMTPTWLAQTYSATHPAPKIQAQPGQVYVQTVGALGAVWWGMDWNLGSPLAHLWIYLIKVQLPENLNVFWFWVFLLPPQKTVTKSCMPFEFLKTSKSHFTQSPQDHTI